MTVEGDFYQQTLDRLKLLEARNLLSELPDSIPDSLKTKLRNVSVDERNSRGETLMIALIKYSNDEATIVSQRWFCILTLYFFDQYSKIGEQIRRAAEVERRFIDSETKKYIPLLCVHKPKLGCKKNWWVYLTWLFSKKFLTKNYQVDTSNSSRYIFNPRYTVKRPVYSEFLIHCYTSKILAK